MWQGLGLSTRQCIWARPGPNSCSEPCLPRWGCFRVVQAVPALTAAMSSTAGEEPRAFAHYAAALGGLMAGIFGASCVATASEAGDGLHAPHYPWPHDSVLDSYDHGAIRRGHQVRRREAGEGHPSALPQSPRPAQQPRLQIPSLSSLKQREAAALGTEGKPGAPQEQCRTKRFRRRRRGAKRLASRRRAGKLNSGLSAPPRAQGVGGPHELVQNS
jgi:hypothetical protein